MVIREAYYKIIFLIVENVLLIFIKKYFDIIDFIS